MTQPLLCSIADVKARTTVTISDAALTDLITSVSDEIEDYVQAWLSPRSAMTLLFDVERTGSTLRMVLANRQLGLRTLTALGTAVVGQPESGGAWTTVPLASALIRPRPTDDIQGSAIVLVSPYVFTRGFNTVTVTGDFGPAAVPPSAHEAAIELSMFDLIAQQGITSESTQSESRTYDLLMPEREVILWKLSSLIAVPV
jgi:hypothetical protein